MANYGFIIDNRRCIGCHACTVACKSEHEVPLGVNRTWVKYIEKGEFPHSRRLFSVLRCNHCDAAPCVEICPVTALYRRDDGIVDFDNRRCIGCKACMQACPYDALYIDPDTHTAAKCNYCAHRVDLGLQPACVNICPTQAIVSGDLEDPESEISRLRARQDVSARKLEKGTRPSLFYIDGDSSSLDPLATNSVTESMWGEQIGGVGHYARFIDSKRDIQAEFDTNRGSGDRSPLDRLRQLLDLGEDGTGVWIPSISDERTAETARSVAHEVSRRAYDAPRKGVLWGWQVTAYTWTKAGAAGVCLLPMFAAATNLLSVPPVLLWLGVVLSLVLLALTGWLLTLDLDKPRRFLYVLLRPQWRSWLVRGAYILTTFGMLLVAWCVFRISGAVWIEYGIRWLLVLLAILAAMYTAFLFAQSKGRDFWQSPILPAHMLAHAVMAGAAIYALMLPLGSPVEWAAYVRWALALAIAVRLACDGLELYTAHPTQDAQAVAKMIAMGRYKTWFWLGSIVVGCLVPLVFVAVPGVWLMPLAGLSTLIGIYISEHIWIRAPQQIPLS